MSRRRNLSRGSADYLELPSDDEIWQWANDPESGGSMLRLKKEVPYLELLLATHERGRLILEIAESDAQQRLFFLLCLYELTYGSVKQGGENLKYLSYLRQRVSDWKSKPDVIEWAKKSGEFVNASCKPGFNLQDESDWAWESAMSGRSE